LKLAKLDKELLSERTPELLQEFREYRMEKSTIKSIKYKVEIIKAYPSNREEWETVDKVCRALVLGDDKEKERLKYKKYRQLDLSNLKHIEVKAMGLKELPSWLRECHNLQTLELADNHISAVVGKEQLPIFLTSLSLRNNGLK
jgi:Leucine-rich repeat (LRR) protein